MLKVREGINVLERLKGSGFTAYELRKQGIIGEARIQKLRNGELPTMRELNFICWALGCNVGDIIEYRDTGEPWSNRTGGEADSE